MPDPIRLGIAGLGTVGVGVLEALAAEGDLIAARAGCPVEVTAVSARSRTRDRGVDISGFAWEDDPVEIARRDDVDVVIEVIGGEDGPAKATAETALAGAKHVVTANKAMLAHHGAEMAAAAEAAGTALRFEAAVAGGIPVVKALTEGLAANRITRVAGVMNGTCNYILTEMEASGRDYSDVLAEAQAKGYAEADPATDVGGFDAAHKLALLAATAFGARVDFGGVAIEGIERVSLTDIREARAMGFAIKLLGVAEKTASGIEARVHPAMVPKHSAIAEVSGVTNCVAIDSDFTGTLLLVGPGAGAHPTAAAVAGDIVDIARGLIMPAFTVPSAQL
ncbi:MAG: homoserine dehydrogenase, partial [Pseudomonadota bacterium]